MSETGKRNPDRINMLGVVVVGICGAVLVYVSIALLQAFYMNDTAQVQTMADYGGQDSMQKSARSEQLLHIDPPQGVRNASGTFGIKIDKAMDLVVRDANDPAKGAQLLVPAVGPSTDRCQVQPVVGPAKPMDATSCGAAAAPAGAGSGAAPPAAGSGAAPAGAGSGSAGGP